jgi:hypothetical protein
MSPSDVSLFISFCDVSSIHLRPSPTQPPFPPYPLALNAASLGRTGFRDGTGR